MTRKSKCCLFSIRTETRYMMSLPRNRAYPAQRNVLMLIMMENALICSKKLTDSVEKTTIQPWVFCLMSWKKPDRLAIIRKSQNGQSISRIRERRVVSSSSHLQNTAALRLELLYKDSERLTPRLSSTRKRTQKQLPSCKIKDILSGLLLTHSRLET